MWVVGLQGITLVIDNKDRTWSLGKVHSVLGETYAAAGKGIFLALRQMGCLEMDVVLITLELTAP